jgi:cellulose synthase/poly-beta-1,6-N-acetylglucosamine synthase-like glycosyltransferase
MSANPEDGQRSTREIAVSVIVPARNEEDCLGRCLASLSHQSGISFEIIVVNDHSTDRTREVAERYAMATVIDTDELPAGWTGKNYAVYCGARLAKGKWFLFTDADTLHCHSSLRHALHEAERYEVDMLSYSPKQEVHTFWERALMPVIFAELRRQYPPELVRSSKSSVAAANGQYLLISREAYEGVGGHAAIKDKLLEDVELAKLVKSSGRHIWFRYGGDVVQTRMYRSFRQMCEGWTKNLALLFPSTLQLATLRALELLVVIAGLGLVAEGIQSDSLMRTILGFLLSLPMALNFFFRVHKAHFGWTNTILAPFGMPIFVFLLVRSRLHYQRKEVSWKGRTYEPDQSGSLKTSGM